MNSGEQLRDEGAALALANAGEDWHNTATALTLKYFTDAGWGGALFEDARAYAMKCGSGTPPSANAWGAVALSLSARKLITKTGVLRSSKAVRSHARSQPVWRLTSLHKQGNGQRLNYSDIKDFHERCDKHPDHQTGMISYRMVEQRLQEEIEELRQYIEQRQWVGLTEDDAIELLPAGDWEIESTLQFAKNIESKLKEKNGG
jgi:hypothetical protein